MEELTLGMMIYKLIQLQELIKEKKTEYMAMQGDNEAAEGFSEGVIATCIFFEMALEEILGTQEELEKILSQMSERK
ncbi:hypothetical protein [Bacillus alveayuensis]|uniref:hypothetical protein n=1 Tax=Aeribacillus alveayuensis TaxID=279215 RepID=UPI0005CD7CFC|nr:hypothetical protein [Bacillus alveayuensis]